MLTALAPLLATGLLLSAGFGLTMVAWRAAASSTVMPRRFAMSAQTLSRKRGPSTIPGAT